MKLIITLIFNFLFLFSSGQDKPEFTSKEFQDDLNKKYKDSVSSPLQSKDLKVFVGLHFFPINEKCIVQAQFIRTEKEKIFKMRTSTSRLPEYKKYGELHFIIEGQNLKLNVYQSIDLIKKEAYKNHLFLPFTDLTCGEESYIGGRYLDLQIPKNNVIVLDFNKAYNPYCAYNYKYSCPIVPYENSLPIAIKAGVMKFHD